MPAPAIKRILLAAALGAALAVGGPSAAALAADSAPTTGHTHVEEPVQEDAAPGAGPDSPTGKTGPSTPNDSDSGW